MVTLTACQLSEAKAMPTTVSFWVAVTGWMTTLLGGAIVYGRQQQKVSALEKIAATLSSDEIMTEAKCRTLIALRQETSAVILSAIQKSIDCMASDIRQLSDSQHQRQVDFAHMTEKMAALARDVSALTANKA